MPIHNNQFNNGYINKIEKDKVLVQVENVTPNDNRRKQYE